MTLQELRNAATFVGNMVYTDRHYGYQNANGFRGWTNYLMTYFFDDKMQEIGHVFSLNPVPVTFPHLPNARRIWHPSMLAKLKVLKARKVMS